MWINLILGCTFSVMFFKHLDVLLKQEANWYTFISLGMYSSTAVVCLSITIYTAIKKYHK